MYLLSHIFLKIKQKQRSCGRVGEKNETVKGLKSFVFYLNHSQGGGGG